MGTELFQKLSINDENLVDDCTRSFQALTLHKREPIKNIKFSNKKDKTKNIFDKHKIYRQLQFKNSRFNKIPKLISEYGMLTTTNNNILVIDISNLLNDHTDSEIMNKYGPLIMELVLESDKYKQIVIVAKKSNQNIENMYSDFIKQYGKSYKIDIDLIITENTEIFINAMSQYAIKNKKLNVTIFSNCAITNNLSDNIGKIKQFKYCKEM